MLFPKSDKDELEARGYEVKQFGQYHFRVISPETGTAVDVWPTKRKFLLLGSFTRAKVYTNLFRDIIREIDIADGYVDYSSKK